MRKKRILLILLILVFASSGCKRGGDGISPEVIEYHEGTEGLEMKFVKNLPPDEILEGSEFIIGLELRNKGASDIESGSMSIYGFESGYVSIEQPEIEFDIEGRKPGFPEGGYEIINFQAKNIEIPEIVSLYQTPFTVRSFYRYYTEAGAEVCINPNIYSYMETTDIICKPGEVKLSGGQGAPIEVTKIQETFAPYGNKIRVNFIIHFKNKGDGEVVEGVYIEDVRLADESITCSTDFIELEGKEEKSIVCSTETLRSKGAYLTSILINLGYDYTSKIDKTLKIRSLTKRE